LFLLTVLQGWSYINHKLATTTGITTDFQIKILEVEKVFNETNEFRLKVGLHNKFSEPLYVQMNISLDSKMMVFNCTDIIGPDDFICNNNTFYPYEKLPERSEIFFESKFILANNSKDSFNVCVEVQSILDSKNKNKECFLVN
jgi:hypothetical protein